MTPPVWRPLSSTVPYQVPDTGYVVYGDSAALGAQNDEVRPPVFVPGIQHQASRQHLAIAKGEMPPEGTTPALF